MSSLLKEAIVDASALRTAALRNAEASVVDKYSDEVRTALNKLLEQDELTGDLGAGPADDFGGEDLGTDPVVDEAAAEGDESLDEDTEDVPYAATDDTNKMDGQNLKNIPGEGEPVEVTLDLGTLKESVAALQAEIDEELNLDEHTLIDMLSEESEDVTGETAGEESAEETEAETDEFKNSGLEESESESEDEEIDISDEMIDEIAERLTVDMGATLSGWAGRSSESIKYELARALAQRRSTGVQDELEIMKKAQEELVFENKQLKSRLSQYEQVTGELKETLQTVNLSNARLLYTNRVLRNTSLNERQKTKIAESISKADSVAEAKTIYNTLQSTMESAPKRGPKTLSEAISRPTSVIRATRKESAQPTDPFSERMRRLAGIK
tara:strand:+ start:19439 stop:20590 length:1152 start_codon:yes stop_codon:yes gene_type:complete